MKKSSHDFIQKVFNNTNLNESHRVLIKEIITISKTSSSTL